MKNMLIWLKRLKRLRAKPNQFDIVFGASRLAYVLCFVLICFSVGLIAQLQGDYFWLLLPLFVHFFYLYKRYLKLSHSCSVKRIRFGRTKAHVYYQSGKIKHVSFKLDALNAFGLSIKLGRSYLYIFPDQLSPCLYKQLRVYLLNTRPWNGSTFWLASR